MANESVHEFHESAAVADRGRNLLLTAVWLLVRSRLADRDTCSLGPAGLSLRSLGRVRGVRTGSCLGAVIVDRITGMDSLATEERPLGPARGLGRFDSGSVVSHRPGVTRGQRLVLSCGKPATPMAARRGRFLAAEKKHNVSKEARRRRDVVVVDPGPMMNWARANSGSRATILISW